MFSIISLVFLSCFAQAELPKDVLCKTELEHVLMDLRVKPQWLRVADDNRTLVYRAPTEKFGHWVELKITPENFPALTSVTANEFKVFEFSSRKCEPAIQLTKTKRRDLGLENGVQPEYLTDANLETVLAKKRPGFVYLWSPGMVYSVKEVETYRKIAKTHGLNMVEVMDPAASFGRFKKVTTDYAVKLKPLRNDSLELSMRGGQIHYPTVFVFANGVLSHHPIIGVKPIAQLESDIYGDLIKLSKGER